MAVLIDPPIWPAHGRCWSHVVSDISVSELHAFAAVVGIPERAFEGDHYDVPEERYAQIVRAGAIPVSGRELLRRLQVSGLRRTKRRGERVVASRTDAAAGHRVDAVLSGLPPMGPVARVHAVLLQAGLLLVAGGGEGLRLPVADVPAGEDAAITGRRLAGYLLGPRWADVRGGQVGYLRRVPDGRTLPVDFDIVLRWPDPDPVFEPVSRLGPGSDSVPDSDPVPEPASHLGPDQDSASATGPMGDGLPLRWVPVRRALALLPPDVAAIAVAEHHRLRPPGGNPLSPAGR